jgi:uncharacterized protein (DUF1800 family)
MKNKLKICYFSLLIVGFFILSSFFNINSIRNSYTFPYNKSGFTERQAAQYLINRFTYGATPGEVDSVIKIGLENWFAQQLIGKLTDDSLNKRLSVYDAINLSNSEVCHIYPPGFVVRKLAIIDNAINKDSVDKAIDKKAFNAQIKVYMDEKGFKNSQDLYKQFIDQHLLRAAYSRNQLQEVLTNFWFNHFNVSFLKGECAQFIPAYERDAIRKNAFGKKDQLLLASAKSPAMLYYLDNFISTGSSIAKAALLRSKTDDDNILMSEGNKQQSMEKNNQPDLMMSATPKQRTNYIKTIPQIIKKHNGLNENYAREVMELHTLGVDGGYTQTDVTEAARILTGWTVYPISDYASGSAMKGLVDKIGESNLAEKGYVHEGDFLFTPNRHDQGEKIVLGHTFPASKDPKLCYQEGLTLLEILAHHSSTAKFICRKLAIRFVSDTPPQSLIDKMVKSFINHDGDIRQVLITMVSSNEFWDKKNIAVKVKSPFELAVSSIRALNADIKNPYPLFNWMAKMGQKIYYYPAPTGFPDRSTYWINTGSLINRMDFGLALASGQIGGINLKLYNFSKVSANDPQTAIKDFSSALLPGTDSSEMINRLSPFLNDTAILANSARETIKQYIVSSEKPTVGAPGDMAQMSVFDDYKYKSLEEVPIKSSILPLNKTNANNLQSIIAGIIIGSPDFQKH